MTDDFERAPRILRLNVAGQPVEWLTWQDAVCLYARELVVWSLGEPILEIRGGRHGIGSYLRGLLPALAEEPEHEYHLLAYRDSGLGRSLPRDRFHETRLPRPPLRGES